MKAPNQDCPNITQQHKKMWTNIKKPGPFINQHSQKGFETQEEGNSERYRQAQPARFYQLRTPASAQAQLLVICID